MAKSPTVTLYNPVTGVAGSIRDATAADHAGAVASGTETGFYNISFTGAITAAGYIFAHYVADTGM